MTPSKVLFRSKATSVTIFCLSQGRSIVLSSSSRACSVVRPRRPQTEYREEIRSAPRNRTAAVPSLPQADCQAC
jgi:hypothetical protein